MNGVAHHAHGLTFDHGGAAAPARSFYGLFGRLINRFHIVAVNNQARNAVASGAFGNICHLHLLAQRCGMGILIIFHNKHKRSILQRCQIERFMKKAGTAGAIANKSQGHARLVAIKKAHGYAHGYRQRLRQMANKAHDVKIQIATAV